VTAPGRRGGCFGSGDGGCFTSAHARALLQAQHVLGHARLGIRAAGRPRDERARLAAQQPRNVQQRECGRRGLPRLGRGAQLAQLPPVHVAPEAHLPAAAPLEPRVGVGVVACPP